MVWLLDCLFVLRVVLCVKRELETCKTVYYMCTLGQLLCQTQFSILVQDPCSTRTRTTYMQNQYLGTTLTNKTKYSFVCFVRCCVCFCAFCAFCAFRAFRAFRAFYAFAHLHTCAFAHLCICAFGLASDGVRLNSTWIEYFVRPTLFHQTLRPESNKPHTRAGIPFGWWKKSIKLRTIVYVDGVGDLHCVVLCCVCALQQCYDRNTPPPCSFMSTHVNPSSSTYPDRITVNVELGRSSTSASFGNSE